MLFIISILSEFELSLTFTREPNIVFIVIYIVIYFGAKILVTTVEQKCHTK